MLQKFCSISFHRNYGHTITLAKCFKLFVFFQSILCILFGSDSTNIATIFSKFQPILTDKYPDMVQLFYCSAPSMLTNNVHIINTQP